MSIETERRVAMFTNNKPTWSDDHVAKQRTEAHVAVASFYIQKVHPTQMAKQKAHLTPQVAKQRTEAHVAVASFYLMRSL